MHVVSRSTGIRLALETVNSHGSSSYPGVYMYTCSLYPTHRLFQSLGLWGSTKGEQGKYENDKDLGKNTGDHSRSPKTSCLFVHALSALIDSCHTD